MAIKYCSRHSDAIEAAEGRRFVGYPNKDARPAQLARKGAPALRNRLAPKSQFIWMKMLRKHDFTDANLQPQYQMRTGISLSPLKSAQKLCLEHSCLFCGVLVWVRHEKRELCFDISVSAMTTCCRDNAQQRLCFCSPDTSRRGGGCRYRRLEFSSSYVHVDLSAASLT